MAGLDDVSGRAFVDMGWRTALPYCDYAHDSFASLMKGEQLRMTALGPSNNWERWREMVHNCATPHRGVFEPARPAVPASARAQSCGHLDGGASGWWESPSFWRPHRRCSQYRWLHPDEIRSCLAGRSIAFEGASLTRQVFLRLMAWMRGWPMIAEHYFQERAAFLFNATHDLLEVFERTDDARLAEVAGGNHSRLLAYGWGNATGQLLWRPYGGMRGERAEQLMYRNVSARLAAVVQGFDFAQGEDGKPSRNFELRYQTEAGRWRTENLSLATMDECDGAAHFFHRNAVGVGTLAELDGNMHPTPNCHAHNKHGLPIGGTPPKECLLRQAGAEGMEAKFAQILRMPPAHLRAMPILNLSLLKQPDAHYMCGFEHKWPNPISGWKMPPNGDCRDILNLNAIQAMLSRICHTG